MALSLDEVAGRRKVLLAAGDRAPIEMSDHAGGSIVGAIEPMQEPVPPSQS